MGVKQEQCMSDTVACLCDNCMAEHMASWTAFNGLDCSTYQKLGEKCDCSCRGSGFRVLEGPLKHDPVGSKGLYCAHDKVPDEQCCGMQTATKSEAGVPGNVPMPPSVPLEKTDVSAVAILVPQLLSAIVVAGAL